MGGSFFIRLTACLLATQISQAAEDTAPSGPATSQKKATANSVADSTNDSTDDELRSNSASSSATSNSSFPLNGIPAASSDAVSESAAAASPENTNATSAAAAAKAVQPRRIKGELVSENVAPVQNVNSRDGTVSSANYIGIKYILSDMASVSVRQQFSFDYPKENEDLDMEAGDLYLNYTRANLFEFLDDGSVTLLLRAYLPTGEKSRDITKHHGIFSPYFVVAKPLNKTFSLEYHFVATWYNQSQNGFVTDDALKANRDYTIQQFLSLGAALGRNFVLAQNVGTLNYWLRPIPGTGVDRDHNAYFDTALTYTGIKNLIIIAGISQEANIFDPPPGKNLQLYDDAESSYYLTLVATL